ncbi:probable H/ACA ribonucleoprotein complex subunit 4 [Hyposmocoma kahamanoa]|uniref:probable H/ACA ribonucleoprotein complex subunit 4 n=1 Tax=Hyposmocoma kahamanoa TaxID=1477025 RepID=UPI000E6D69C4|nr:probable H/ACA ribonucleoprotein complex subunit 4 [Hyposmocoma kahamanoa]
MNFVLLVLLALKILAISGEDEKETRERAASLVVLPPLVLGYEELYVDNDDNQPAKKDMDYPNENGGNKVTQETTPKDEKQHHDELEQREKINEEVTTEQPKDTKKETTKKEEKKDNKYVAQKLSDKSPGKKKEPIKDKKKKNNKTATKYTNTKQ